MRIILRSIFILGVTSITSFCSWSYLHHIYPRHTDIIPFWANSLQYGACDFILAVVIPCFAFSFGLYCLINNHKMRIINFPWLFMSILCAVSGLLKCLVESSFDLNLTIPGNKIDWLKWFKQAIPAWIVIVLFLVLLIVHAVVWTVKKYYCSKNTS